MLEEAWERERALEEARQAEEEARKQEEEWLAVERDLREEGGAFLGEGTTVTAIFAVVRFHWKSGGGGGNGSEGGRFFPGQGEGTGSGL